MANRPALSVINPGGASRTRLGTVQNAEHEKHAFTDGGGEFSDSQTHAAPDILAVWLNDPECIPLLLPLLGAGCGCATEPGSFNEAAGKGGRPDHQPGSRGNDTHKERLMGACVPRTDSADLDSNSNRPPHTPVRDACDGQSGGQGT